MLGSDAMPTMHNVPQCRLGALYEACYKFMQKRQANNDLASCIMYNSTASIAFEKQKLQSSLVEQHLATIQATGGTSFITAMKLLQEVVSRNDNVKYAPLAIFMSDGECDDEGSGNVLKQIIQSNPEFTLSAIAMGNSDHTVLQNLAAIGKGKFTKSEVSIDGLVKAYEQMLPTKK